MDALRTVALFAGLDGAEVDRIAARSMVVSVRHGARIFARGARADAVYAIMSGGRVRIGTTGRRKKALMVETLQEGDVFGEVGVIHRCPRSADAYAEGRVRLLRIGAAEFLAAIDRNGTLAQNLNRLLAERLRRTFTLLEDATFESVEVRLARQLLYLARRDGIRTGQGVRLAARFRQGDLADLLGTTNRSIITVLNAWRTTGLVTYDVNRAQVTLIDEGRLEALIPARDDVAAFAASPSSPQSSYDNAHFRSALGSGAQTRVRPAAQRDKLRIAGVAAHQADRNDGGRQAEYVD